jgi:hypothetical protein
VAQLPQPGTHREALKDESNVTRDGDPKLAAERKRRHPMWEKRHREGPVRQQRA